MIYIYTSIKNYTITKMKRDLSLVILLMIGWDSAFTKQAHVDRNLQCHIISQGHENIKALLYWPFVTGSSPVMVDAPHKGSVMQKVCPCQNLIMMLWLVEVVWGRLLLPIYFWKTSLALGQSHVCPNASAAPINKMGKCVTSIHQ